MKKKIAFLAMSISVLVVGVAFAVTNTYSVTASTSPTKAGTVKAPANLSLQFNYSVGEVDNNRPSSIKEYQIKFAGIQLSQKGLAVCTADTINGNGNDAACPKAAVVGTGSVDNVLGPTNDPSNKSLHCFLELTIYNSTAKRATLYLKGRKANAAPKDCITDIDTAIDAQYVTAKGANAFSTLKFTVPPALLHPIPGLDNSVLNVQSTINNVKTKGKGKNGKALSYYHSVGGCKNGKRAVQVTFISETDQTSVAKTTAKCKK
jgi:hypothetical protein